MSGGGNGGVGGTNGAVTVQPRPVESPFGSSLGGRPGVQPMQPYGPPSLGPNGTARVPTPMQPYGPPSQGIYKVGPNGTVVELGSVRDTTLSAGSAPTAQQPCPQQPYGVIKPLNPFQPQNFEQRLNALEEWQKTRV